MSKHSRAQREIPMAKAHLGTLQPVAKANYYFD
jgi:hypothetical protein